MPSILLFFPLPSFCFLCFFFERKKKTAQKRKPRKKKNKQSGASSLFFVCCVLLQDTETRKRQQKWLYDFSICAVWRFVFSLFCAGRYNCWFHNIKVTASRSKRKTRQNKTQHERANFPHFLTPCSLNA